MITVNLKHASVLHVDDDNYEICNSSAKSNTPKITSTGCISSVSC